MGKPRPKTRTGPSGTESVLPTAYAVAHAPELRRLLLGAYDTDRRDLPWRGEADPYRVWVSEVMLQQTRVETVIPYYKEWVKRFPDVTALAAAREDDVLLIWQGLGYYSRARNLLGAARVVRETHGGQVPSSVAELRALPGVGEYTAGAVASIAFSKAVPAVDGNVRRVLSRVFDLLDPSAKELRSLAEILVDPARPGDFNQALMEQGALVCTPRDPGCGACPLEPRCLARQRGTEGDRPVRKARKPQPRLDLAVVVCLALGLRPHRVLLRKRPQQGLLAGMWEFPGIEIGAGRDARSTALALARELGLPPAAANAEPSSPGDAERATPALDVPDCAPIPLPPVAHVFTHMKVRYHPFLFPVGQEGRTPISGSWIPVDAVPEVPISVAQRKILAAARGWTERIAGK